jgi:hypothetical protein
MQKVVQFVNNWKFAVFPITAGIPGYGGTEQVKNKIKLFQSHARLTHGRLVLEQD